MDSPARSTRSGLLLAAAALVAAVSACGTSSPAQVQTGAEGAGGTATPSTAPSRAATPSVTPSASPVTPVSCPLIPGLPNTENGVFELTAFGTDCATATALGTRALESEQGKPFAAAGFDCTSRYDTRGYPSYRYTCVGTGQQVTFVYSR